MKARHAAALALVGWYLMMQHPSAEKVEPLSDWLTLEVFDSAAACNVHRRVLKEHARRDLQQKYGVAADKAGIMAAMKKARSIDELDRVTTDLNFLDAECVASDDPRLEK